MTFEEDLKELLYDLHTRTCKFGDCNSNEHCDNFKLNVIKEIKERVKEVINKLLYKYKHEKQKPYAGDVIRDFHQREIALTEFKLELELE